LNEYYANLNESKNYVNSIIKSMAEALVVFDREDKYRPLTTRP